MTQVFNDSKYFADAVPLKPRDTIVEAYNDRYQQPNFNLTIFVGEYFMEP